MHRRFLFPLAAGIVGLVAISPALAANSAPGKGGSAPAKSTTSSTTPNAGSSGGSAGQGGQSGSAGASNGQGGSAGSSSSSSGKTGPTASSAPSNSTAPGHTSSTTCATPETNQSPAPQMGDPAQNYQAGDAGSVDIERLSATELRVSKAMPNDGWTEQVAVPSGPRVTVKFTRQGQSPSLIRLAASMDQKGAMIHVRVQSCG